MNQKHEDHLSSLITAFTEAVIAKYTKGQTERGGYLPDMSTEALLDNALDEAIDQFVYLMTIKQQLSKQNSLLPAEDNNA